MLQVCQNLFYKHFGSIRFAYNYYLNERKVEYEKQINKHLIIMITQLL